MCTQRSVKGRELKSSSSAMLGRSLNILEMRLGRRAFVLHCWWLGFAGLVDSEYRCLRPKRAVLLISLRKQQGFARPFMSGCRHRCNSGRRADRWCLDFRSRIEGRRHTRVMLRQLRAVFAACLRRLCVVRPCAWLQLFLLRGVGYAQRVSNAPEGDVGGLLSFVVVGRLSLQISFWRCRERLSRATLGGGGFCRC